jgi:hypothetical protein
LPLTDQQLTEVRRHLDKAVAFDHLTRRDWRRQTDSVRHAFVAARLFVDCGAAIDLVDGHINDHVKVKALADPHGVKAFFNRRFHDAGFKARRLIVFDTCSTRKMGGRASGRDKLHFHGFIERPRGWTRGDLERLLERVFGKARPMGKRQFHFSSPNWRQHYTLHDAQVTGPLGKLVYALAHAGTTYRNLDLNDGKRSRRAPPSRRRYNLAAGGLARGVPSNFSAAIVFADSASKRAAREAFDAWVEAESALRRPQKRPASPARTVGPKQKRPASPARTVGPKPKRRASA